MKGPVKFFNDAKGFGFIIGEDGTEYFVHRDGLKEGVALNENDAVEFEIEQGDKGPKAVNVSKGTAEEAPAEEATEEATEEAPAEEATDTE